MFKKMVMVCFKRRENFPFFAYLGLFFALHWMDGGGLCEENIFSQENQIIYYLVASAL